MPDRRDTRDATQLGAALLQMRESNQLTKRGKPRKRPLPLSALHDKLETLSIAWRVEP